MCLLLTASTFLFAWKRKQAQYRTLWGILYYRKVFYNTLCVPFVTWNSKLHIIFLTLIFFPGMSNFAATEQPRPDFVGHWRRSPIQGNIEIKGSTNVFFCRVVFSYSIILTLVCVSKTLIINCLYYNLVNIEQTVAVVGCDRGVCPARHF